MGPRDAGDAVAELLDEALDVEGDHRLVLDDEHVGRDLLGDLRGRASSIRSPASSTREIQDCGDLLEREALDGAEQEGLARPRRDRLEIAVGRAVPRAATVVVLTPTDDQSSRKVR